MIAFAVLLIFAVLGLSSCAIVDGFKESNEASGLGGKKSHP